MVCIYGATTWCFLTGWALAQSNNSSSFKDCPVSIKDIAEKHVYNSSGTIKATFQGQKDPWQISVALTDTRAPNLWFGDWRSDQFISLYLSVPESLVGSSKGNETFFCAYMMTGLNETSTNSTVADESCDGVLSDECIDDLTKLSSPNGDRCPRAPKTDKCERNFTLSQINPLNFSSSSCTLGQLPEIDLPNDYRTYGGLPGGSFSSGDRELETFDAYDLKVRQSIPILLSVRSEDAGQSKMVCIAPNNVLDGSRIPESEFPPSGAVSKQAGGFGTGVLMMGCIGAAFMINGLF